MNYRDAICAIFYCQLIVLELCLNEISKLLPTFATLKNWEKSWNTLFSLFTTDYELMLKFYPENDIIAPVVSEKMTYQVGPSYFIPNWLVLNGAPTKWRNYPQQHLLQKFTTLKNLKQSGNNLIPTKTKIPCKFQNLLFVKSPYFMFTKTSW